MIEAKDYIGGRLKEEKWFEKTIAIGAGWIHMLEENHLILQLAKKYNLKFYQDNYDINKIAMRSLYTGRRWNRWYVANTQKEVCIGSQDPEIVVEVVSGTMTYKRRYV